MQIGYIGLGKMGKNMVMQMLQRGHQVVAWNRSPEPLEEVAKMGAVKAATLPELITHLQTPRVLWFMLPAGELLDQMLFIEKKLIESLAPGDIVIDGGNSKYTDTQRRAWLAKDRGVIYMDVGTSGGPSGARHGACMMIGGEKETYQTLEPLFESLCVAEGFQYCGESGSGHYVKMVHNAIEYGFMQAMGEGFQLLKEGAYPNLDLAAISRVWNHGSIIESKLMKLAQEGLEEDAELDKVQGVVDASGEAQWAVETALQYKIPLTSIENALLVRYASQKNDNFSNKIIALLRNKFGGHKLYTK